MTADEFVQLARSGSEKLRLDEVVVNAGNLELHGKGILRITRTGIFADITFCSGEKIPEIPTGIYTTRDKWTVTGLIDDSLHFSCGSAGLPHNRTLPLPGVHARCTLKLHPIDLVPAGWDALSRNDRAEFLKKNPQNPLNAETSVTDIVENDTSKDVLFQATLNEYPLHTSSWGAEIRGETESFDFVLAKIDEKSDLRITLESKGSYVSQGEKSDFKQFYAFMNALAFMNGMNAWPYRVEYWRAGRKLIDRVTAADRLARTVHVPFPETLAFDARTGTIKWNFQGTVKLITAFFENESALSNEVAFLLFLFRQAGDKGVHRHITSLTLCALLENLVRHIFRELDLGQKAREENPDIRSFEQAKNILIGKMDPELIVKDGGYKRLHDFVQSVDVFSTKQIFQSVVAHFGLQWQNDMELVFKTWQDERNVAFHQSEYSTRTEDDLKEVSLAESRIAGTFNILLLKLFGYTGYLRHSTFEDGYRLI